MLLLLLCWILAPGSLAAGCSVPSTAPEKRAVLASILVKGLVTSVDESMGTAEVWIVDVYKGTIIFPIQIQIVLFHFDT